MDIEKGRSSLTKVKVKIQAQTLSNKSYGQYRSEGERYEPIGSAADQPNTQIRNIAEFSFNLV